MDIQMLIASPQGRNAVYFSVQFSDQTLNIAAVLSYTKHSIALETRDLHNQWDGNHKPQAVSYTHQ